MAKRKTYYKKKYKRRRGAATSEEGKARSMQTSWRHATGTTLPISRAKELIENPPECPYCKQTIFWREFSVDHVLPRSRGGTDSTDNVQWVCRECNIIKGNLLHEEFLKLIEFLDENPVLKSYLYPRLKAGGAVFGRNKWRKR